MEFLDEFQDKLDMIKSLIIEAENKDDFAYVKSLISETMNELESDKLKREKILKLLNDKL